MKLFTSVLKLYGRVLKQESCVLCLNWCLLRQMKLTNHYSMSYYQRVLLLFFTLIIINKIAPPPPIRDFNNNTYDCNEESGRSALIWQQIINKSAPPPQIRDHPLFAVAPCGWWWWSNSIESLMIPHDTMTNHTR